MKLKAGLLASLLAVGLIASSVGSASAETLRFASEAPRSDTQSIAGQRFNELLKAAFPETISDVKAVRRKRRS